jgi:hypothetical protein
MATRMKRTCLALAAIASAAAPAALAENQIWTNLELKTTPAALSRIELTVNTELRFSPDGDLSTFALSPGIGYRLNDGLKVAAGYRYGTTFRHGPDPREHRLWQQLSYDLFEAGAWEISGRTRLEERWREDADGTALRLRQRFSLSHPVPGTELEFEISNEAYFSLNETTWAPSGFHENRARAAVDWKAGRGLEWSLGYLNQFRKGTGGSADETNHHLLIGLSAGF